MGFCFVDIVPLLVQQK
jgi:hypothetical protein